MGRCFNCGGLGHLARNCRQRGRGGPREAHCRYQGQGNEQVAKIDAAGEIEKPPPVPRDRVEELRRQLKEAEVEEALNMITATTKGITLPGDQENPLLGPTVTTEVIFEGMPVVALLDTGSPVTIVSLEFALRALAARRPEGQQPEEWKQGVKDRLETPTIKLRNYGRGELDIVSQMKAQISKGGNSLIGTVQVQKGAPVELLMGTDLQPQLGFLYFEPRQENIATDLFSSKLWDISEAHSLPGPHQPQETTRPPAEPPMVCLIKATRLPARHVKLVRARIDCPWEKSFSLFESAKESLEQEGLQMEDGVAEPDESGIVTLAVQNHSPEPVCLKKGQVLGKLQQAALLSAPTPTEETIGSEVKMVHTQTSRQLPSSVQQGGIAVSIPEVVAQSLEDLPTTESDQLRTILTEYADTFTQSDADLGSTNVVSHSIKTGDHSPIRQPPRRIPFALRRKVEEMVDNLLRQGVIWPSKSPWTSPIVLVAKKDGSTRFCVDYRRLNAITKMGVFQLPRIDDSLVLLSMTKYFSTLDLASGYWQVAMDEESREKTAFVTHSGLYEFVVMPFGLCNAPATFQRLMETVLADLIRDKCIVYIDDILVMGETLEDHLHNLKRVLQRLTEAGLKLKPAKCHFLQKKVEYMGHIVSAEGIAPDPRKVDAVRHFPQPDDHKRLRSFLGLASYYRRFIQDFSVVANPLFDLTPKNAPFVWTQLCEEAFGRLKELMTGAPTLAFPDFARAFILETDASGEGLGAVLAQKLDDGAVHPIAYASRTLQPHERNYGVTELEALGVVWAVKHFRPYLYGHRCEVYTDHEALKSLLNTPHPSGKLAKWGLALQELDLDIRYPPGRKNSNADALSRSPISGSSVDADQPEVLVAATLPLAGGETTYGSNIERNHGLLDIGRAAQRDL